MDNNRNTDNYNLQALSIKEKERLTNKYGEIDISHAGTQGIATLMGEKRECIEKYRTKHFTCYTVGATL